MSDRDAFRAEQQERRRVGKAKQHEKRLENATYTAAEVKVLTETASKVAYELGRKDALTEIANEMSVEFYDDRIKYVTIQIDHESYNLLRAASGAVSDEHSGGGE